MFKRLEYRRIREVAGTIVKISDDARRYNAFPKVIRTADMSSCLHGTLLAAWYCGNAHVDTNSDGQIWGAFSADEGRTWSDPFLILDDPSLDCRNIAIARAPDGSLIMFLAKYMVKHGRWTNQNFGFTRSSDHGRTWSPFTTLISGNASIVPGAANGNGYGDAVVIDGTIYIACYGNPVPPSPVQYIAFVLASSDNGNTWRHASTINAQASVTASEADFCIAPGACGDVMFGFTRTSIAEGDMLHYFESTDRGRSWSPLVPTNVWGQSPDVQQLADGRYIVAYRARSKSKNYYVGYFLLDEDFPSLTDKIDVLKRIEQGCLVRTTFNQPGGDVAYPSVTTLDGSKLLVVYYDIGAGGVFGKIIDEARL
ncbi:MAG: exo-alpha-sialidase [Candidatus Sigynarchaeota archaeon]